MAEEQINDNKSTALVSNRKDITLAKDDQSVALAHIEAYAEKNWETGLAYGVKKGRAFEKMELGKNMIKRGYTFEAVYELIGLNKEDIFQDP
ncbi:MAG: hypothetical protein ROO73_05945 [Roseivirga sp.]